MREYHVQFCEGLGANSPGPLGNRNGSAVTVQSEVTGPRVALVTTRPRQFGPESATTMPERVTGAPRQERRSLIAFIALSRKNVLIVEPTSRTYWNSSSY
jgi:hypothetical protein